MEVRKIKNEGICMLKELKQNRLRLIEMFPPNLQKSIKELDRQISLLETECYHMESEKSVSSKQKALTPRELPSKPYVTGPSQSIASYPTRRFAPVPMSPNVCPAGNAINAAIIGRKSLTNEKLVYPYVLSNSIKNFSKMRPPRKREVYVEEVEEKESKSCALVCESVQLPIDQVRREEMKGEWNETILRGYEGNSGEAQRDEGSQSSNGSISSIKLSENSDPGLDVGEAHLKSAENSEKYRVPPGCDKWSKNSFSDKKFDVVPLKLRSRWKKIAQGKKSPKLISSGEEYCKKYFNEKNAQNSDDNFPRNREHPYGSLEQFSRKKRRARSSRTRKKNENEISVDVNITKAIQEKEIQCKLLNEDSEKEEFLTNLSGSIKTLHLLITELRKKSSEEKKNDVLKDMQNTLLKMNGMKMQSPLKQISSPTDGPFKFFDDDDRSVLDVKKTFFGVKKFCEQLSDEKAFLSDELALKNRTISTMKNKEKEYLSLISNLKVNLEKIREQSDGGERAKTELVSVRIKLDEETKVIEALKKSHAKMQDLVENYVLENDKLRTQLRVAKMESQKYNVLLAGKEAEIKKYKEEIGSFQRQISEQLNLLRLKALANPVEGGVKALTNKSKFGASSIGKNTEIVSETNDNFSLTIDTSKTSLNSLWNQTQDCNADDIASMSTFHEVEIRTAAEENYSGKRVAGSGVNDCGYTSCRSDESEVELTLDEGTVRSERSFHGTSSCKNANANKGKNAHHKSRKKSPEKQWKSSRIVHKSSQNSFVSTSSECI